MVIILESLVKMSRLCIKNVPSVSESKLKETFSQIGNF